MAWWRMKRVCRQEDGGDRHWRTTVPTDERWRNPFGSLCFGDGCWHLQQCARQRQIGLAPGVGKDPVVPDPMEPRGQDMQQEAAHELANVERHRLVYRVLGPIVFPAKRYASFVLRPEADISQRREIGAIDGGRHAHLGMAVTHASCELCAGYL